eukprot:TRINITY_DN16601_c0_g1_i1.p1 TRINITY_DN16601_c0_g1~~TRINITY_DN16601_c0_g1_i1.p1  ORF type:complete len:215 (+),score=37.48 TRINITY_DN16601_c0_g1_i1:637-1281(+)
MASDQEAVQQMKELLSGLRKDAAVTKNRLEELLEQKDRIKSIKNKENKKSSKISSVVQVNTQNLTVCELLGTGASTAAVYSCYVDGFMCAMKEFTFAYSNEASLRSFEQEISLLEGMPPHPNIARYLFHTKNANKICLFLTKYSGTLRDVLSNRKDPFPLSFLIPRLLDIARGLEFLHFHNIIHRDLKMENIFVVYGDLKDIQRSFPSLLYLDL